MKRILTHVIHQPFVVATGTAALVHSTWALGTLFAGNQPPGGWALAGWLVPALLIAFALDVGQIVTSAEIRAYGLTRIRALTFLIFAGATYYLQWLYIAHHMPNLALASGVRDTWKEAATTLRDAAVWIIPALLPLSTLLYTFSGGKVKETVDPSAQQPATIAIVPQGVSGEVPPLEVVVSEVVPENTGEVVVPESTRPTRRSKRPIVSANGN